MGDTAVGTAPTSQGQGGHLDAGLGAELARYAHGRVPRQLRLRQVLAEAHDLFVERGYRNASMDELAARVGVSKPLIYDLAGPKEQVFQAVMAELAESLAGRIAGAVAAEPDPIRRLHAGALAFFGFVDQHRGAWLALLSGDDAPVTAAVAAIRARQSELVAELLRQGAAEAGRVVRPIEIEATAHAINGAFESMATWWLGRGDLSAADLADLLFALISPGLDALTQIPDHSPAKG